MRFGVGFYYCHFLKFTYCENATKFCEIFTLVMSVCTVDKSKVQFSKKFWPSQNIRTLITSIFKTLLISFFQMMSNF